MRRITSIALLAAAIFGLSNCASPDYVNLVNPEHGPGYQRVNSVEKAKAFYPNSTLIVRTHGFYSPDGTLISDGKIPVGSTYKADGYTIEYLAPDGKAYIAHSAGSKVYSGTWSIDQFGKAYPRICTDFPQLPSDTICRWPSSYLREGDDVKLYRGDVAKIGRNRYPAALAKADPNARIQTVIKSLGAGNAVPFTAN